MVYKTLKKFMYVPTFNVKLLYVIMYFSFSVFSGLAAQTPKVIPVVVPDPPPWVTLVSPADSSTVDDTLVTFVANHERSEYSTISLYSDSTLNNLIQYAHMTPVTDNQDEYLYTIQASEATYYWNVTCQNYNGMTTSDTWSFSFSSANIAEFYLSDIPDRTHLINHHPRINWRLIMSENVQSAYQLQISTYSDFSTIDVWDSGFISSSDSSIVYNGPSLHDSMTYYMRLRVDATLGISDWRDLSFRMNSIPAPEVYSPVDNAILSETPIELECTKAYDGEVDSLFYRYSIYVIRDNQHDDEFKNPVLLVESDWMDSNIWTYGKSITENASYMWTVQLNDSLETSSMDTGYFSYSEISEPPGDFKAISPRDMTVIDTSSILFTWKNAQDPDPGEKVVYYLYLKYNDRSSGIPEPKEIVYETSVKDSLVLEVSSEDKEFILKDHESYFWNVKAEDLDGNSVMMSESYLSFTVNLKNNPPDAFELISPDSVIVVSSDVNFAWTEANDSDPMDTVKYKLVYFDQNTIDSCLCSGTSCVIDTLKENHEYSWYVSSFDLFNAGSFSDTAVFWLDHMPEAPLPFSMLSPVDHSQQEDLTVDFVWKSTSDPDPFDKVTYALIYTQDMSDTLGYDFISDIADTSFSHTMSEAGTYFWKVVAGDQDGFIVQADNEAWMSVTLGQTAIGETDTPTEFALHANYPNPFNPSTSIDYDISENVYVTLNVFNMKGQLVESLINEDMSPGRYSITWDAADLGTGVYIFRLQAGDFVQIRKALLIK
jgi:Secretion system C-terminal sorting domain